MASSFRRLVAAANGQLGLLTRQQAQAVGVSGAQLRNRVKSGSLIQTGTNTYRLPGVPPEPLIELQALLLDIGGQVWASGPTSAALFGFDGFRLRPPFHVTILRGRDVQRIGHRIHTTAAVDLIDRATVNGVSTLSGARTLIDLARTSSAEELTRALDSGLRDGRFSEDLLHRRIVALRSKGRYGIPRLIEVIEGCEVTRGGQSWLEREYLRLVHEAGLPAPLTQQVLTRAGDRLVRVDFRFPGTPVVVEVLGYRFHRTKDELRRDIERMNALVADGFEPYQFSYDQIVGEPIEVVDVTRRALVGRLPR